MLNPYWFQTNLIDEITDTWDRGKINICAVLPTGGGKTVVFSYIVAKYNVPTCVIAHRQELVHQISVTLATNGVAHKIIGPSDVIKMIVRSHMKKFGRVFYDPSSPIAVAGVDTICSRFDSLKQWGKQIVIWVIDEGHHLLRDNKWGRAVSLFPNAYGLAVTATPMRADGNGLGRNADGIIDTIIEGPSMRQLISERYLTPYKIMGPFTQIDLSGVPIGKSGDFSSRKLKLQVRKTTIVGDVVNTYINEAYGKLGVTFATDVETAVDFAKAYNENGVPAEVVTAKTPANVREEIFERFQERKILQVVNVDILGEGFDCPAMEVVSFARPTMSYVLYCQQFGRVLRPMPDNPDKVALILDHVGNVITHKLPDRKMRWTLDRRECNSKKDNDGIPVRVCPRCTYVYESIYKTCPFCGFYPQPQSRSKPNFVDGDLTELTPEIIAALYGEVQRIDMPVSEFKRKLLSTNMPRAAVLGATKQHDLRQISQVQLREIIELWAQYQRSLNRPDSESYRRFYHTFGCDVITAQTLGRPQANKLKEQVVNDLWRNL